MAKLKIESFIKQIRIILIIVSLLQVFVTIIALINPNINLFYKLVNIGIVLLLIFAIKGINQFANYGFMIAIFVGIIYIASTILSFTQDMLANPTSLIIPALRIIFGIYLAIISAISMFIVNKPKRENNTQDIQNKIKNLEEFQKQMDDINTKQKSNEEQEFEEYNKRDKEKRESKYDSN